MLWTGPETPPRSSSDNFRRAEFTPPSALQIRRRTRKTRADEHDRSSVTRPAAREPAATDPPRLRRR